MFTLFAIFSASNALLDFASWVPSSTPAKSLPFIILFALLIILATPTPKVPAPIDIPAVFKP